MFIYHFNRLIHNKIIWGSIAFIIAVAFGLGGVSAFFAGGCESSETIGRLNGKAVSVAELSRAEFAARRAAGDQMDSDAVFTQAISRIAMARLAADSGLVATTPEIQSQISQIPAFQRNGVFDPAQYQLMLTRSLRMSHDQFAHLIALGIADEKINALTSSASWISPMEAEDYLANFTDRLTVQYAILADQFAASDIKPTEAKVLEFYEQNSNLFMVPDKVAVDYIAIPVTNYYARLVISEHDMRAQYEDNLSQYSQIVEHEGTNDVVLLDFEDVTNSIHASLMYARAREAAETNAIFTLLDMAISARDLQAVADHLDIEIKTSNLFGTEGPIGIENPRQFAQTVNDDIDPNAIGGAFGIFLGANHLYLFTPAANVPAHLPPLDDVRDRAITLVTAKVKSDAFLEQQQATHESLLASLAAGKTFAEAAEAANLTASTNVTLTVSELSYDPSFPDARTVAYAAMSLAKGGLSKPTFAPKGAFFVHMVDRERGDPLYIDEIRDQLRESQSRNKAMLVTSQWHEWFISQLNYAPRNFVPLD